MSLCALASADTNMAASPARADRDTDEKGVILWQVGTVVAYSLHSLIDVFGYLNFKLTNDINKRRGE
jgi:hypothetical protein